MSISRLESLPVELLQPIFFWSGYNVALLQASQRISARLSSEYVYDAACTYHLTSVLDDRTAQTAAQTCIFASRWMTWGLFKSWLTRTYETNGCLCGLTRDEGCFDAQWPPNFENATEMVFTRSHLPRLAFIRARIPMKLLCGPWTSDKIQFLKFLLWLTSMTVDWNNDEVHQTAIKGRLQAMREQNLEAVELFNHNRRLGKFATSETVRFAVIEAGCNRSIVFDTISTAAKWGSVVSWECEKLDGWCEERIKVGDPKGQWLRKILEKLRTTEQLRNDYSGSVAKWSANIDLDSSADNYDGGVEDQLVVRPNKWNQVSFPPLLPSPSFFFRLFFIFLHLFHRCNRRFQPIPPSESLQLPQEFRTSQQHTTTLTITLLIHQQGNPPTRLDRHWLNHQSTRNPQHPLARHHAHARSPHVLRHQPRPATHMLRVAQQHYT
jgi:hypothetical protein